MSGNFFDRLEAELGGLARQGTHLDETAGSGRRRFTRLMRRSALGVVLAMALAASLVSEFPASANGSARVAPISMVRGL
jgi:hypothetical protein